jgi:hypothetical protein
MSVLSTAAANSTTRTAKALVEGLTKPPPAVPTIPSGIVSTTSLGASLDEVGQELGKVVLFRDESWESPFWRINISELVLMERHRVRADFSKKPDRYAFKLPVGIVVTLTEFYRRIPEDGHQSLNGHGRTIDLVGTRKLKTVSLGAIVLRDLIQAFFWRKVDRTFGAIELFENVATNPGTH